MSRGSTMVVDGEPAIRGSLARWLRAECDSKST
jgi:hypothetical protein